MPSQCRRTLRQKADVSSALSVVAVSTCLRFDHHRAVRFHLLEVSHSEEGPGLAEVAASEAVIAWSWTRADLFEVRASNERREGDYQQEEVPGSHQSTLQGMFEVQPGNRRLQGNHDAETFREGVREPDGSSAVEGAD